MKDVNLESQEKRAEAPPPVCSEHQLQSQLHRSRVVDLIYGTEGAILAAAS